MVSDAQMLKRKQIESKTTDEERWLWLFKNSGTCDFVVVLDNDMTYIEDYSEGSDGDWDDAPSFDESIGDMPGIFALLKVLNVKCERV